MRPFITFSAISAFSLSACAVVPELPPAPVVVSAPVQSCVPVSALVRQEIPAETKVQYAISSIDNPPYAPIETTVKQVRIIKQAQVIYVDSGGREVIDICENVERGFVGPAAGEVIQDN
ncbi:MAG: hypothetical protein ABJG88_05760 [Litorimonas sp.]